MTEVLAALSFLKDFKLGPTVPSHPGFVLHYYVHRVSGERVKAIVVGVVSNILDLGDGVKLAVLVAPNAKSPVIRVMYAEQSQVLDDILLKERDDISRIIFHRQYWSQTPGDEGAVFVRILPNTMLRRTDISTEISMFPIQKIAHEIPLLADNPVNLEQGALVMCLVEMFRVDSPQVEDATPAVYSRAYVLDAILCSRFMRSTEGFLSAPMAGEDIKEDV